MTFSVKVYFLFCDFGFHNKLFQNLIVQYYYNITMETSNSLKLFFLEVQFCLGLGLYQNGFSSEGLSSCSLPRYLVSPVLPVWPPSILVLFARSPARWCPASPPSAPSAPPAAGPSCSAGTPPCCRCSRSSGSGTICVAIFQR